LESPPTIEESYASVFLLLKFAKQPARGAATPTTTNTDAQGRAVEHLKNNLFNLCESLDFVVNDPQECCQENFVRMSGGNTTARSNKSILSGALISGQ
jgi:hypothetical protein